MKIKILGSRANIKPSTPRHRKYAGVLVDNKLLFDLGERSYLKLKPQAVFITHLHKDHAFFMVEKAPEIKISIYGPELTKKMPSLRKMPRSLKLGQYKITPSPTVHSHKLKSQAYLIQKNKKKILYTGDLVKIQPRYLKKMKKLDLVVTEASYLRNNGFVRRSLKTGKLYGHNGIPNLIKMFKPCTNHIVLMHFGSWFYRDIIKAKQQINELAKQFSIKITVTKDGQTIQV